MFYLFTEKAQVLANVYQRRLRIVELYVVTVARRLDALDQVPLAVFQESFHVYAVWRQVFAVLCSGLLCQSEQHLVGGHGLFVDALLDQVFDNTKIY